MDINNLQRTPSYSYRVDVDRIKQRLQQADKNSVSKQRQSDSVDISERSRMALKEKMSATGKTGQNEDITKLSPMNFGSSGIMNDFEKIMSELGGGSVSNDFVSNDYSQESVDVVKAKFEKEEGTKSKENSGMLKQKTGSLNHFRLNLGVSSSARKVLNGIYDCYANMKQ